MLVSEIGEFQLIDTLARTIANENERCLAQLTEHGFRVILGIGDDAAAWEGPPGVRVLTTDTMVENVHFIPDLISWGELGWKAMAVNLSDVAAMGCLPLYSVITLGLRGDLPVEGLAEMYSGMMEACRRCGGAIVGGDVVRSPVFFITVAMEGAAVSSALLTRRSARPGDKIAVTGHLGCSGGGLRMLLEGRGGAETRPYNAETAQHLRDAHHRPMPRVPEGMALAQQGVIAAMDVSDGLVDDLGKLCKASGVGAVVHAERVPADELLRRAYPNDWLELALGGGEDYELLFTAPPGVMERAIAALDVPASIIGDIVAGPPQVTVLDGRGRPMAVKHGGWDHFR
jgi:thiamine-monophosphate kinase